ncbi:MAG: Holliday junction branch migration protein RuvA [Clostridia bacterium]|nr:Holliday junction branch migration protein RuvA [Clostridia bacterium]
MISYIKGQIVSKQDGSVIIETGGIGYEIFVSNNTLVSIGDAGENCLIYTHMHMREDGIILYGFSSTEEKNLFNLLISVSGIGAKLAVGVLSGMKLSELILAIAGEDTCALQNIKGLGKKTAERIILELKEKVNPINYIETTFASADALSAVEEAVQVLLSLGLTRYESIKLAKENSDENKTAEDIVKNALKNMAK